MPFPKLKNKLILAPMEDVSHLPFRLLCRKYGAAMAYTQQISAIALVRNNPKSLQFTKTNQQDKPVGLQLFGRNPETLVAAAKKLYKNFDVIDLNFGCPSKKVVSQGYGAALLKEKSRIKAIIEALVKNIPKPITVKMRSGFKKVEAVQLAKTMEQAGASAITIHARTKEQKYSGKADWSVIKQVKETTSIPIIGNGDVTTPQNAEQLLEETGCDYIMIARAAMHNPLIFQDILHYQKTGKLLTHTEEDKVNLCLEYFSLDPETPLYKWKQIAQWFMQGFPGSSVLRNQLTKTTSKAAVIQSLKERE